MTSTDDNDNNKFSFEKLWDMQRDKGNQYITQFFIPLTNGKHAFIINGKYKIYSEKMIKAVYFNRMNEDANNFYFKYHFDLRESVCEIDKPMLFDDKFNISTQYKHDDIDSIFNLMIKV